MRCCGVLIQVSQDGSILRLICMFFGCDMPVQLALSSEYFDRLEDRIHYVRIQSWTMKYATFYASTNGLARFSTCNYNLPTQLLLCVKSPDNKHIKCLGNN